MNFNFFTNHYDCNLVNVKHPNLNNSIFLLFLKFVKRSNFINHWDNRKEIHNSILFQVVSLYIAEL